MLSGLGFAGTAVGARLAIGDYIAVQIPKQLQRVWDWQDWVLEPRSQHDRQFARLVDED